jgi:hypothetical protein
MEHDPARFDEERPRAVVAIRDSCEILRGVERVLGRWGQRDRRRRRAPSAASGERDQNHEGAGAETGTPALGEHESLIDRSGDAHDWIVTVRAIVQPSSARWTGATRCSERCRFLI